VSLAIRRRRFRFAPYLEFVKKAFAREATYRFEVFTSIGSLLVRVFLLRMVWTALYAHNVGPRDLPLHAVITWVLSSTSIKRACCTISCTMAASQRIS
jgi:hypothetical protein